MFLTQAVADLLRLKEKYCYLETLLHVSFPKKNEDNVIKKQLFSGKLKIKVEEKLAEFQIFLHLKMSLVLPPGHDPDLSNWVGGRRSEPVGLESQLQAWLECSVQLSESCSLNLKRLFP